MRRVPSILLIPSFVLCLATPALSQAPVPFNLRVEQGLNVWSLADGGSFTLPADAVGLPSTATVTVTYRGAASASISNIELTGHTDFSIAVPTLPVTLMPNQSLTVSVRFLPTTSARAVGRIAFAYMEGRTSGSFSLNMAGVAPEFVFGYAPQPAGNTTPLSPGGLVPFPITSVNTTSTVVFIVTNRGSGAGAVKAISATGAAFQLAGLPLSTVSVDAGKDLRFSIQFTPKQLETSQGTLQIEFVGSQPLFRLEGSGSGPVYAYEVIQPSGAAVLLPNQVISMPDALINDKSALQVRFRNTGNDDGSITAISVQGAGFTLSDVPFLPLTLTPGSSATLTITFSPTQPGRASGRLRIGADTFEVSGNGLGAALAFSYAVGSSTTTVQSNGSVFFPPIPVGRTSAIQFTVSNSGTASATVNSINLGGSNLPFTLSEVPALPLALAPGASSSFAIQFAPTTLGAATATLKIDTSSFTLSGSGAPPDPLPSYKFDAPGGPQQPMQQPAIGLTLDAAYPLALTGTLTLAFNSDVFSNDPAVQFATGGRTVNFTIPANSRNVVFPQNTTQIRIQTGTVAGAITLTPSFTTEGGINLTPVSPLALNLVVPQLAPRLLGVTVSQKTASGFTLLVTGYATSRSVTQMDFQFTPVAGETVGTTRLTLSVEPSFLAWYQGSQSQQFGSLFTATVPFTLQGDVKNVDTVVDAIQSLSVTLANSQGTSNAVSVSLR